MSRGIPIYGKVLAWLAVNVLVLCLLLFGFLSMQFRMSLDWMLIGPAGERISSLGDTITSELSRLPKEQWKAVLHRYDEAYGVTFALFSNDGAQAMGAPLKVPSELVQKLSDKRTAGDRPPRRPPEGNTRRPPDAPPKPRFMQRAGAPARYWGGIHLDLVMEPENRPLTLVMVSSSITGGGLFLDVWPWVWLGIVGLGASALIWMPFVRGLTRSIGQLNDAARSIAHGNFDERVSEKRNDELGELSTSVNAMAQQLDAYVEQQRRITADVAHELCSPIARMQMSLGIIGQRSTPEQTTYLEKLDRELQHMAKLVEEVLSFTKAAHLAEQSEPEDVDLKELIDDVVARDASDLAVNVQVPELHLRTHREALDRAISNIIRNAVRYASQGGRIDIKARELSTKEVEITLRDYGPGVPAEALEKIFDAFFRLDPARGRNTGGAGLGLAIVKRCVDACRGKVSASLASPGLSFSLVLPQ